MAEEKKSKDEEQYVVLARKYRPQNFDDLVGQNALVQTLTNAIKNNRLHHAYILTGIRGVGKTTTARIIAKALNCMGKDGHSGPTVSPCGICENCRAITEGRHIDVMELDAASRTGVDDIREILDGVRYKPTNARYKIYIIDEVHMLSKNAFNALLKTLEEPPSHVKFIFATTEIRKVPVTILSRCQRFDLQRISIEDLIGLFKKILANENVIAEDEALHLIAKAADGSARDGESLLDQAISLGGGEVKTEIVKNMIGLSDRNQIFDLFEALLSGQTAQVIDGLQEQYKNGANPTTLLNDLINITHLLAKTKLIPTAVNDAAVSESERAFCDKISGTVSIAVLSKMWQMMIKGLSEMNIAPVQIDALEMILIRIAYSANFPTPYELLSDVKKNSKLIPISSSLTEKTSESEPVKATESPQFLKNEDKNASLQEINKLSFNTPDEMLSYFEKSRKMLLCYALKNDISIVTFENGHLKMNISDKIASDFIMNLQKELNYATGINWDIEIARGPVGETIAQQENAENEANKRDIAEYPLVKAILAEFKGAKIETLTRKTNTVSEEAPLDLPQIIDNNDLIFDEEN